MGRVLRIKLQEMGHKSVSKGDGCVPPKHLIFIYSRSVAICDPYQPKSRPPPLAARHTGGFAKFCSNFEHIITDNYC